MTLDVAREKIEECLNNGALTRWEESFLTSISDKVERGYGLSDREQEILQQIHKKIFVG